LGHLEKLGIGRVGRAASLHERRASARKTIRPRFCRGLLVRHGPGFPIFPHTFRPFLTNRYPHLVSISL
jgi:hypothetical protein